MVFTIIANLHAKSGEDIEAQLRAKLAEASKTYSADASVLGWYTLHNTDDSRKWTIVKRLDQESSVTKNRDDPEFKAFGASLLPLLENGRDSLTVYQFDEVL
ncbi:Antibiotic biosynthesis monooxygenase protein [Phytophthora megakarya]|uniref:Antibiotic biosynthesis monooxygenase protein n=1 Tax=Phytophthora megakarya TaxID=4795 RepID=A0A225VGT4_9STRA|nr:Antibiotic biosynthesis monooxygenase protein [Phytophthora megakarya]